MPGFLFWNLKNKPLQREVAALARERAADIIVLAEYDGTDEELLSPLNESNEEAFTSVSIIGCKRVRIYTKHPTGFFSGVLDSDFYTIQKLSFPGCEDVIAVALHGPSKLYETTSDQNYFARQIAQDIRRMEEEIGHNRVIVFGDFNMNPFEEGMITADAFNAVMSRRIAEKGKRKLQGGREYRYFYNPMWSFLGDLTEGPPGTYYYSQVSPSGIFWHMFDQVLIRPELLPYFELDSLSIVSSINGKSLLNRNLIPNKTKFSDHLPIFFVLNLLERSESE